MAEDKQASSFYLDADDSQILPDINTRKEFLELRLAHTYEADADVIPYYMLSRELAKGRYLRFKSYQRFVSGFMNPNTPYTRLLVNHDMGTGKTVTGIGVAMKAIEFIKTNPAGGWVYVLGFTRAQFERDLLRFPELGFITRQEQEKLAKLRRYAALGAENDIKTYKEYWNSLRRRLGSGRGNGFFKFIGYRELANHVFVSNTETSTMDEIEINQAIKEGKISINMTYVEQFRGSLIICDEVHNVYNSLAKNNWGVAIQLILNTLDSNVSALFLSGTILKNSQTELVDVINLLRGSSAKMFRKADFFDSAGNLLPGALDQIGQLTRGRVSFLVDVNPESYPSYAWQGTELPGVKYLKFERCAMPKAQMDAYRAVADDIVIFNEHPYIFDMVFPVPEGAVIYKTAQLRMLDAAPAKWRAEIGIQTNIKEKTIQGPILERSRLAEWSGKYTRMLTLLDKVHERGGGKVFIYHRFVHMTGVFLISHILSANGYIPINGAPNDQTRCAFCSMRQADHKADHSFIPARFIAVHGELDKRALAGLLDKYNAHDNTDGGQVMIVVGSRVLREAHDLMATRSVFVITRPDNIPSLLQIMKRAIRANSHQALPEDKRHVDIHIFVSSLESDGAQLTYEEEKYAQKVSDYVVIQQIERVIHAYAIDGVINRAMIGPALMDDAIGHLRFDPVAETSEAEVNTSTFNLFHREGEVIDIIYVIKRLFIEHSKVWQHDDLWAAVRSPPFDFEYDTSMFSPESFAVAMHRLLWKDDYFGGAADQTPDIFSILFNPADKQLLLDGKTRAVIVAMADFYIAFVLDPVTHRPQIYTDGPWRIAESLVSSSYSISAYIKTSLSRQRYLDLKGQFIAQYKGKSITEMTDAICLHGQDFHVMLAEEVISYVFDIWTNAKAIASTEYNAFYFQMLYFYDTMGLVVWLNSTQPFIRDLYADIEDLIRVGDPTMHDELIPKSATSVPRDRGDLIAIARAIERSSCSWCPSTTKTRFDLALQKSKTRFAKLKTATTNVTDDMVPIGHLIGEVPRFFHPLRSWFSSPEYGERIGDWKENDIIVGFDTRSAGGLHVRFRLRNPRHKIKKHQDARLVERGIICTSRTKEYLTDLAKKIGVTKLPAEANLGTMCREIRARLLYLELIERAKGSKIKWYYNQFEVGGSIDI